MPTLTDLRNWSHSAAAIIGFLAVLIGLAQTAYVSIGGGNAKYGQWLAAAGAIVVLVSKAIDSLNSALLGGVTPGQPAPPANPQV